MLLRHISKQHGLSRNEYLKRWGLRRDRPLTAPGYSEQRSSMAKDLGLGRKTASLAQVATPSSTGFGRGQSAIRGEAYTETEHPFRIKIRCRR
jgi:hypothetical protein